MDTIATPTLAKIEFHIHPELLSATPDSQSIITECQEICKLILTKNRAYGSSFCRPLNVFSKLSNVEAINARIDDKLARIKQAKDFSEDTELDLIGYLILKRIAIRMEECGATPAVKTPAGGPACQFSFMPPAEAPLCRHCGRVLDLSNDNHWTHDGKLYCMGAGCAPTPHFKWDERV